MKKTRRKTSSLRSSGGESHRTDSSGSEFYTASPTEKPLYETKSGSGREQRTSRHQARAGHRAEKIDYREKMALQAILRLVVMIFLLAIAFFLLWKGIGLYEESIWLDHEKRVEVSPVLQEVALVGDFDIQSQDTDENFADRIELWRKADRMVRSADALLQRNNYDQAISRCQDALRLDPAHRGALERLGQLYFAKENHVQAVNAYIRLLSVDPSLSDVQKKLIQALDAFGDAEAVMYMAEWYLEQNTYDADIQLYLANARYAREEFAEAAEAYGLVLRDTPRDVLALELQASSYMQIQQYDKALVSLGVLRENNHQTQEYYRQIAICNAQLLQGKESLQSLGRAAQLFDKQVVVGWIQDSKFDPIRTDRAFQAFIDRIAGEETRRWLEKVASDQSKKPEKTLEPVIPIAEKLDTELLKPRK